MNDEVKSTVYNTLQERGFQDMTHRKGLKSNRMKDNLKYLATVIQRFRNPLITLPTIENLEDSDAEDESNDLEVQGI